MPSHLPSIIGTKNHIIPETLTCNAIFTVFGDGTAGIVNIDMIMFECILTLFTRWNQTLSILKEMCPPVHFDNGTNINIVKNSVLPF